MNVSRKLYQENDGVIDDVLHDRGEEASHVAVSVAVDVADSAVRQLCDHGVFDAVTSALT